MSALLDRPGPRVMFVTDGEVGAHLKQRRLALGINQSELSRQSGVDRTTLAKMERGDRTVRESTIGAIRATLERLEHETGQIDTPDLVTNTIELPDGTKVTFAGPADGVAEAAAKFLRDRYTAE